MTLSGKIFSLFCFWNVLLVTAVIAAQEGKLTRFEYTAERMGVPVRVALYAPNEKEAEEASDALYLCFDRLNAAMTDYDPESEIIQVCRKGGESGQFVPVSDDLAKVLAESRYYTTLTGGTFDITVSPIVKLWRRSRSFKKLPPDEYLADARQLIGNDKWELKGNSVRILKKGVRFDVGGIAKGYALDAALELLRLRGIHSALIDAGGDLRIGDPPPGEKGWQVKFATLNVPAGMTAPTPCFLTLANVGIASSGDTFRYVEIDGLRYSHLIDPRTGRPLTTPRVVSVIAPTATMADALASAVTVLGPEEGRKLVNTLKKVDFLFYQLEGTPQSPSLRTEKTTLFE